MRCSKISKELAVLKELRRTVAAKALEAAENQGLNHSERLNTRGDQFEGDLQGLALHSCTFYECYECKKPYFGGMADC